jgi:hypothetical protein
MMFTSRNWFAMQGPVAIILISWNVIFIWETSYWTRAIKRFALFDLLKSLYSDTKIVSKYIPSEEGGTSIVNHFHQQPPVNWSILTTKVNVKNTFTSHIDRKIFLTFLLTSLSLYIFNIHHFFRNACIKSGLLRLHCFPVVDWFLSVYILMSFDFPFGRLLCVQ